MMKNKRLSAKKVEHKILEEQADKLKDKLDSLKEQIRLKRQQKQMSKTSASIFPTNTNTRPSSSRQLQNQTQSSFNQQSALHQALVNLKIENIEGKLKEKNIQTLDQFKVLKLADVDLWKEIPVGYRIKIKKYLQNVQKDQALSQLKNESRPKIEEMSNIQSIIQNRKQQNKFVPISRIKDVESEDQAAEQLQERQQEQMMISIMEAFGGRQRASSFKSKEKKVIKRVHWSPLVDEMQKNADHEKHYPKQRINKRVFQSLREPQAQEVPVQITKKKGDAYNTTAIQKTQFPDYKYCWICLKKINQVANRLENRQFCSIKCFNMYRETVDAQLCIATDRFIQQTFEKGDPVKDVEDTFELSFDIV